MLYTKTMHNNNIKLILTSISIVFNYIFRHTTPRKKKNWTEWPVGKTKILKCLYIFLIFASGNPSHSLTGIGIATGARGDSASLILVATPVTRCWHGFVSVC